MALVAYGVGLESSFPLGALPILSSVPHKVSIDVRRTSHIEINEGIWVGGGYAQSKYIQVFYHDSHLAYHVDKQLHFELYPSENLIVCHATSEICDDVLRYWILQQMLPLLLRLSGLHEPVHGAAVSASVERQRENQLQEITPCIGFLGPSHAGKSTLLSHFLSKGHDLVTDDLIALASPGYTEVFPALPYYRSYRAFESLGVVAERYFPQRRPLQRLYFLKPAPGDAEIQIDAMNPSEVLTLIMKEKQFIIHNELAPKFLHLLGDRFRGIARLAREVPAFRLHVPRSMDRLPEVYDFIQQDLVVNDA